MSVTNFKTEVTELCRQFMKKTKKAPNVLQLSTLRAYDMCALTLDDLGPECMDVLMSDGPVAYLSDWGFMGLNVEWTADPMYGKMTVILQKKADKQRA